jgi:trehalose 6-phosphate phosphatase
LWASWAELASRLAGGSLLAAFDYDGTLVPIRPTPEEALVVPPAGPALARLAARPGTTVAVVSGRPVAQLGAVVGDGAWLIGVHGLEVRSPEGTRYDAGDRAAWSAALAPLRREGEALAAALPGVRLEDKRVTLALHTRQASRPHAVRAAATFRQLADRLDGFMVLDGKELVEVRPRGIDKGTALLALRERLAPGAVLYVGDDRTDEDAFAALGADPAAVTVRVGEAMPTAARYSLSAQGEVAELVRRLAAL